MSSQLGQFPSWTEYVIAISTRFRRLFDDPLADLVSIKQQHDPVETYLDSFECALTRLTLTDDYALRIFLTNLQRHHAYHVRQFNATNISEAARLACLHESSLLHTPQRYSRPSFPSNPSPKPPNSYPPHNYAPPQTKSAAPILPSPPTHYSSTKPPPNTTPTTFPNKPDRKYSYEEMQTRRAQGLCMLCDEQFSPGRQLKHKRSQIFVMECEDADDTSAEEPPNTELPETDTTTDAPTISINALEGSSSFMCTRVTSHYSKRQLHILIETGSSHNFLDL